MDVSRPGLRLFGGPGLEMPQGSDGGIGARRHPTALAAILAVEGGRAVTRDKLVALLWPDADAEQARKRLRVALHALREALGHDAVVSVADGLRLDASSIDCDLVAFEFALDSGRPELAVEAYGGPFLDGFHLPDSLEFDRWADAQRDRLARLYRDALELLADRCTAAGEPAAAADWWWKRVREEPSNGRAVVRLMEALERAGDPAAALRQADAYARLLREEFDTEPAPEVRTLVERIRTAPNPARITEASVPAADRNTMPQSAAVTAAVDDRDTDTTPAGRDSGNSSPATSGGKSRPRMGARTYRWLAVAVPVAAVVAYSILKALGIGLGRTLIARGELEARQPLVLADFQSISGDSLLSQVVTELLRVDLRQSSVVSLADRARVQRALTAMRRPADAPLDERTAREVASRLGSKGVVAGEVGRAGLGYILTARVVTADSGRVLATFRQVARDSTVFVRAIERLSRELRRRVGESLASVRASRQPGLITTSSLPALMKFREAQRENRLGEAGRPRAIRLLEEATALDPEFGAAWHMLASMHLNNNQRGAWLKAIERAVAAADHLIDLERREVSAMHAWATGDLHRAEAEYLEFPGGGDANAVAWFRGDFALAEEYAIRAIDYWMHAGSDPGYAVYGNLVVAQLDQGKVAEARATAFASQAPDSMNSRRDENLHWIVDFVESRYDDAAARPIDVDEERRGQVDFIRGRLGAARATLDRWVANGPASRRAEATAFIALAEYFLRGDDAALDVMERLVRGAVPDEFSEQVLAELAVVLAIGGRVEAALRARAIYEARVPEKGRWRDLYLLHAVDGFIALTGHRSGDAIAALRRAREATPWTAPADAFLGFAYDRLDAPDSAIAAYTRYIETPWSLRCGFWDRLSDPVLLVPIHERLTSLLMEARRPELAAHHATRVIDIWKDADPEFKPRVDSMKRLLARAKTGPADPAYNDERLTF